MENLQMRKITILLSSPSDTNKHMKQVKTAIDRFNSECAEEYGIYLVSKNWKDDTYPEYGVDAQTIINKQIVDSCDIVIALFGARIGTPTKNHESGTLEEIAKVHEYGKCVLTYFFVGKTTLTDIEPAQLSKVNDFKNSYNGLYKEYKSASDLEKQIFTSLKLYGHDLKKKPIEKIIIRSLRNGNLSNDLHFEEHDFLSSTFIKEQEIAISELMQSIQSNIIPKSISLENNNTNDELSKSAKKNLTIMSEIKDNLSFNFFKGEPVQFSSKLIDTICYYCQEKNITIDKEEFFFVGGASEKNIALSNSLNGTEKETQKVRNIWDLNHAIQKLFGCLSFLKLFNKKYYLNLVISNIGDSFCEDIDLIIKFSSDAFFEYDAVSFTELQSAKTLGSFVEQILAPKGNTEIEEMKYGREIEPTFFPIASILGERNGPDLRYYNDLLMCKFHNIYPYVKDKKGASYILKFRIGDLKQFSSSHVCGSLIFEKPIDKLEYIITTKSMNKQEKGILSYKEKGDING